MKTVLGLQQKESGLRRAAFLIHCSLVEKKHRVSEAKYWPLPFDDNESKTSVFERLKQRQLSLKEKENG